MKKGILIDNERWFLKYPKIKQHKNLNCITNPVFEYLASRIYGTIGIDTQKTLLE